jgi:hypothetical protein
MIDPRADAGMNDRCRHVLGQAVASGRAQSRRTVLPRDKKKGPATRFRVPAHKSGNVLLSHRVSPCSTIGAGRLNDRVRDGIGCGPSAIAARNLFERMNPHARSAELAGFLQLRPPVVKRFLEARSRLSLETLDPTHRLHAGENEVANRLVKPNGPLVLVSSMRCRMSTSSLSTSWSTTNLQGVLILELASRLDAFSGYPFRT